MNDEFVTRHEWEDLQRWVKEIDNKLEDHSRQEARMEQRFDTLERDVAEIREDLKSVLDILTRARGIWWFLGILVGVFGSLVAAYSWAKDHIANFMK